MSDLSKDTLISEHSIVGKVYNLVLCNSTKNKSSILACDKCVFENDSDLCDIGYEFCSDTKSYFTENKEQSSASSFPSELTAPNLLKRASDLMIERAVQYDSPEGERSMEKIVNSFNALTGKDLTEAQGWMFMVLLKLVRDNTRVVGHKDSCDDLIAYAALYGESRLNDN